MPTKTPTRPHRLTKVPGFAAGRRSVYHDNAGPSCGLATGLLRVGTEGKSKEPGEVFHDLGRGPARRLRKALRAAGFRREAAEPRFSYDNPER